MKNQEILLVIILGAILALLLVSFIVAFLFLYQKKQNEHKKEMAIMHEEYDQQILRVQFEMQEATLKEISEKLHHGLKNNIVAVIQRLNLIAFLIEKNPEKITNIQSQITAISEELTTIKDEVRLTSHSLSPDRINQVGLVDAIRFEAKRLSNNSSILVDFIANENLLANINIGENNSVYIFRIFQEIIGNIISHSKATRISIQIDILKQNIFELIVQDNGVGFNVKEKKKSKSSGLGLAGMQKRAIQMNAELIITSDPNNGTNINLQLPLPEFEKITINENKPKQTKYSFN